MAQTTETTKKAKEIAPSTAAQWHRQGNALADEGKLDRAISAFRRALRLDDSLAEVHNDLGTAYFEKRWYAEAEECFRKAIERNPAHSVAHANRGAALRALGRLGESRRAYQRALWLKLLGALPRFMRPAGRQPAAPSGAVARPAAALFQPIREAVEAGQGQRAVELAEALLERHPDDADALHMGAVAYEESRDYPGALAHVRRALEKLQDRSEFHITLARILLRSGDLQGALNAANTALRLEPGSAAIHATISGLFHPWREDLAEQAARHAIELEPQSHSGHANLAAALWGQGKLEEAERAAREAVRLSPKTVSYRANLALILKDLGRVAESLTMYRQLMADAPDHGKVCQDMGTLAREVDGAFETARAMFRRAQQSPEGPRGMLAEGLLDLAQGSFAAGWTGYEARRQLSDQRGHHDQFAFIPDWDGASVPAGKLLVYGEQGLGDEVMFASLFSDLQRKAKDVAVLCDARLGALFARSFPDIEVIGEPRATQRQRLAAYPGIACKVAAGSLGGMFRRDERDFPQHRGYLVADPQKVQAWRERLGAGQGKLGIGISWKGGVQMTGRSRRSIELARLEPLLALPGVSWISLQHDDEAQDPRVLRFAEATRDMDELAALMGALDLVVSVCNTNVHVAGAIGKEVLVMAPFVPEWRYGVSGERMIWYPSARVFRQSTYGDWSDVIGRVQRRLEPLVKTA
jgi:tetratricopeptide (TPR) repeat protein